MGRENTIDGTEIATHVFTCIFKTFQKFGVNHIAAILVGSNSQKILSHKHNEVVSFGVLKEYSFDQVKEFIKELIEQGYLEQTKGEYPVLHLLDRTNKVVSGLENVTLKESDPNLAKRWTISKEESVKQTLDLFKLGKSVLEVATERSLSPITIMRHLAEAYKNGEKLDVNQFVSVQKQMIIKEAFEKFGTDYLSPVKKALGNGFTWEDLKWVQAKMLRKDNFATA